MARRAKNEVGKKSKLTQLDKTETENGKPGKRNANKLPLRALICRINRPQGEQPCVQPQGEDLSIKRCMF